MYVLMENTLLTYLLTTRGLSVHVPVQKSNMLLCFLSGQFVSVPTGGEQISRADGRRSCRRPEDCQASAHSGVVLAAPGLAKEESGWSATSFITPSQSIENSTWKTLIQKVHFKWEIYMQVNSQTQCQCCGADGEVTY